MLNSSYGIIFNLSTIYLLEKRRRIIMAGIVEQYIEIAKKRNPGEPEFHQTVEEVLNR